MSGGNKHDQGKLPYHLLPTDAVRGVVDVLRFGAIKYSERNWEKGMDWHRLYGATMRHMTDWWEGHDTDPETGMLALSHAATDILMLLAYQMRGIGTDDRPHRACIQDLEVAPPDFMHLAGAVAVAPPVVSNLPAVVTNIPGPPVRVDPFDFRDAVKAMFVHCRMCGSPEACALNGIPCQLGKNA